MSSLPEVRNTHCVRYRFRYSECTRCAESCPPHALSPGEAGIALDSGRCSGCGLCAAVCPTAVFCLPRLPPAQMAEPRSRALAVACAPAGLKADVQIPCLADLDLALLAHLAQRGVALTLRGAGHCDECAHGRAGSLRVAALFDAMDELCRAAAALDAPWCAPVVDVEAVGESHRPDRRRLFRRWLYRAEASARRDGAETLPPASAIRAAAHFVPVRRRLADAVLARLDAVPDTPELALLLGVGTIEPETGRCTGCEACFRVCPTGALTVSSTDSQWRLSFDPGRCVGCGVCVEACAAEALRLEHRWQPPGEHPLTLHALRQYRCQGCGRFFVGLGGETCPVCHDDEKSFTAIFG